MISATPKFSHYLPDNYKWKCDYFCDAKNNIHSRGCKIRRDALVKRWRHMRERIIRNRRKSHKALQDALYHVTYLASRWVHINEELEARYRMFDDMMMVSGIDPDSVPENDSDDEYDEIAQLEEDLLAAEVAKAALQRDGMTQRDYNDMLVRSDVRIRNIKDKIKDRQQRLRERDRNIKLRYGPEEERDWKTLWSADFNNSVIEQTLLPAVGLTRFHNRSHRYQPQLHIMIPKMYPSLRNALKYPHLSMELSREYDREGKVDKCFGLVAQPTNEKIEY